VMISQGSGNKTDQPLYTRLWGSGFFTHSTPGSTISCRVESHSLPRRSSRRGCRSPTRHPRYIAATKPDYSSNLRRPRNHDANRLIRDGLPDANQRSRTD
jgi:hypothetical protein